jgi:hypothetical protein
MFSVQEDDVNEVANPLKENVVPQAENSDPISLKSNLKSTTLSSSPSATVPKRYLSKFKRQWFLIRNILHF